MTIKELQQSYIYTEGRWSTPSVHTNGLLCLIQQFLRSYDEKQEFQGYEATTNLLSQIDSPIPHFPVGYYFKTATKIRIDGFEFSTTYYIFSEALNINDKFYA